MTGVDAVLMLQPLEELALGVVQIAPLWAGKPPSRTAGISNVLC